MSNKPPSQDQNNSRNEYIPSYITKAPFYAEGLSDGDYLEHQRLHATPKDTLDKAKWYERGRKSGPAATKFRKGACENCGAITHKTKDCLERPRKHGAKWTGKDIQADEIVADVKLGWDAKRDRWNGYDAREFSAVVREYEDLEKLRQGATTTKSKPGAENDEKAEHDEDNAEAKYGEETDMGRSQPTSTRQLRLREDTAKYLLNLDLDSAQYDPKTRSMGNTESLAGAADSIAEEGFVRPASTSDDAAAFERAQKYAWETQESINIANTKKLHLQANPTEGELLLKKQTEETTAKKAAHRQALIDKYGEQPHLQNSNASSSASSRPKAITSTEAYAEYDRHGNLKLAAGQIKATPRSKYPEDIMTNNHTSVFGSWWANFTWGYACCHSTVKNSYCTGEAGRTAFEEAEGLRTGQGLLASNADGGEVGQDTQTTVGVETGHQMAAEQLRKEQEGEHIQERKDEALSNTETEPRIEKRGNKRTLREVDSEESERELEAYKRNRLAAGDPMSNLGHVGEDGLLEHKA